MYRPKFCFPFFIILLGSLLCIPARAVTAQNVTAIHTRRNSRIGSTVQRTGEYGKAQAQLIEALNGRRNVLGSDHPDTLMTMNDFGVLRREQKRYEEAEEFLTQAFKGRQTKLGPDHPHTLESIHELALLYEKQELYGKAEEWLLRAVKGRRVKLSDTHPHTQESIKTLIELCEAMGESEKAEDWRAKLPQIDAVER